ncbi:unnamed protein product [Oikopleura dioica]|uniref:Uncharacterized protein n=1 Tax=Oikopleura dioica TaxID=34765 RepID=E4Y487_OIKDI|nr:unnamed protein product [Oikopleura dioica]
MNLQENSDGERKGWEKNQKQEKNATQKKDNYCNTSAKAKPAFSALIGLGGRRPSASSTSSALSTISALRGYINALLTRIIIILMIITSYVFTK